MQNAERKYAGTLLGCAVGDAVGLCYQFAHLPGEKREPLESFSYLPFGRYPPGQYSDDTDMTLAIVRAILERGEVSGPSIAKEFVRMWETCPVVDPGISCSDAIEALIRGAPWDGSGTSEGRAGNGTAMRASPIGLWDYDDMEKLRRDSEIQSVITHKDRRAVAGAIAVAAAVAYNVKNGELDCENFISFIKAECRIDGGGPYLQYLDDMPKLLGMPEAEAISIIARAGQEQRFSGSHITPFVVPTVLVSLYAFLKHPDSFLDALALVYRAGGDIDTTGAITGAISGSCLGAEQIPKHLKEGVLNGEYIAELARKLWQAKQERHGVRR
ncbi:MAG: hypothetical protein DRP79_07525 [Planctomycetota bacterium]|nr:MAG: hypothetical protein DRP79_07525 [Planctomycetota bacterium]